MHFKSLTVVLVILIISLISPSITHSAELPADLADLSLEDLMQVTVQTASKFEQKTTEAPSSVSIITASDIEKYGYRTLADILRSVRSFYTTYDRNYSFLGIRGFSRPGDYNSRVLLLVDGVRVNDSVYSTAAIGTDFILEVDLIDRIEIIRGPGSSLYGSNAFFAVINVITRKGEQMKGVEFSGDAGSFDTYRGRVSYGSKVRENIDMLVSATYYESKGDSALYYPEFDAPETNNGKAEDSDLDRFHSFFGRASFHDFTLEGAFVKRKKLIPTASFETLFNDTRNATTDQSAFIDLKYAHTYASDWDVLARVTYGQNNYDGRYVYDYAEEGDEEPYIVVNKDYADSAWWGTEAQVSKKLFDKHRVIFGGEYRDSFRQDQGNYDEEVYLHSEEDSTVWGVYAQGEFQILSELILNAGLRHDHYSTFGGTTNPRFALVYHPFDPTVVKAIYGKAFRAPNAYELYYHDGYLRNKPNPDLDPETIQTYELILEQRIGEHLQAIINGFYYEIDDLINGEIDPADELITYKNVDEVEAKGIEFELQGQWSNGLRGRMSYSYQLCEDSTTGKTLTNSPKHLAKFGVTIPLFERNLFLGIEEQYTGKRKTSGGNHVDDFFITNVTLFSHQLFRTLRVSASVYNLFDEKYSDPGSAEHAQDAIEQDGRSFRFKVTYTF